VTRERRPAAALQHSSAPRELAKSHTKAHTGRRPLAGDVRCRSGTCVALLPFMRKSNGALPRGEPHWSRAASWWCVPLAVLVVYWPCLFAGLVYDDWVNFDRNQPLRDGDWLALVSRPYYGPDTTYWRPLTSLAMGLAYQAGPFGVHLLALVLHTLAALTVGAIARLLLTDHRLALFAALLFALHPVQVESVAWASALPGVPSALLLLLSVRALLLWSRGNSAAQLGWAAVWLLGALLAKESGVVAVPSLAVVVLATGGPRSRAAKLTVIGGAVLLCGLWLVVHAAMVGWRPVLGEHGSWLGGVATTIWRQVALLLVPWPLTPFRAHPLEAGAAAWNAAAIALTAVGCVAAVLAWRRLATPARIAGALATAPLVFAALTHDAVGPHPVTDRYLYASVSGFVLLAVAALRRRVVVLGALTVVYGAMASFQCRAWQDDRAFVAHVARIAPEDATVRVLAGELAARRGDAAGLRRAREHYRAALEHWQHRHDAFALRQRAAAIAGLAWCDFRDHATLQRAKAGLGERFREALTHDARYVPAWVGLGVACGLEARHDEAVAAFATALAIDPMCPEAWFNLARTQLDLGRHDDARDSLRRALRCNPALAVAAAQLPELR
jgi:tetratricopeptide (TPR) repeat protein